jgi:Tol biopolymer transport system component
MGEVYRARDTRLERTVAIKVLPTHFSSSPEVLQRFEREAKTISQLSHPHICAIYDVGSHEGTAYLVMELLEGETLAARLASGPLPLAQTLRYGAEMADALNEAHRQGIVHRDLKPGNVMLTKSGVKLLDFGLAKAMTPETLPSDLTSSPTVAGRAALTQEGTILGTFPYMAPEQLEGKETDGRTDIFAFGATLYEMATGRRAFSGSNQASLVSAILRDEPASISSILPMTPHALDRVVRKCLAKDPEDRWQNAADLRSELQWIAEGGSQAGGTAPTISRTWRRERLAWAAAATLFVALAAAALLRPGSPRLSAPAFRFGLAPPEKGAFEYSIVGTFLAVSPDGSRIGYVASDPQDGRRIWVRPLSTLDARPIAGTEGASSLFWSPDGRLIGFFAGGKLRRIDISGGAAVPICDVPGGGGMGTWGRGGNILFSSIQSTAIYRVSSSGGEPAEVVRADPSRGEGRLAWPWFLPDGERFLYLLRLAGNAAKLMLAEPGKPPRALMAMLSAVQYADPGYLVFSREGTLLGQRFDWKTGRLSGEPFAISEHVRYFLATTSAAFALSRSGTLAYQAQEDVRRLVWIDRTGREVGTVGPPGGYVRFSIAPDGRRIFFDRARPGIGTPDIWSFDLERGVETRITSDVGAELAPLGMRDGRGLIYSVASGTPPQLYLRDLATGKEKPLFPKVGSFHQAEDISPDGRTLAWVERNSEHGTYGAWTAPLSDTGTPVPLLESPFHIAQLRFSPDGRFVALVSAESGRDEAYVMPYPGPGEKTRVSLGGASLLRWSRDGRELFYLSADRRLISVPIRTTPSLQLGSPTELFSVKERDWQTAFGNEDGCFDVSPDGKRFLAAVPEVLADKLPLTVVVNWASEVAEK